jgi:putative tryptophan/tyrosine transport system substrate-binding protein
MRRRDFISLVGSSAIAWPLAARAQQPVPVIGYVELGSATGRGAQFAAAFRKGLSATGYVEGKNVTIEYHWLEGRYERLPALMAELVGRPVAVIATPASIPGAQAAKAATSAIPIVFGVGEDPVKLGLVASLSRPGGNATGVNFFVAEVVAKRPGLLHDLVPAAARIAMMVNPGNVALNEETLRNVKKSTGTLGLQIQIFEAGTSREIDAAFAAIARERADALFVAPDSFFASRSVQFATLAARNGIPASYSNRYFAEVGGLMSYGTDNLDSSRQVGVYAGKILNGAKPADLPVTQSTKFEFVINLQTARALGLDVPFGLLLAADEVIE